MRNVKFLLLALAALGLIVAGCDREITGDVKLADTNASVNCFSCHSDQDWDVMHAQTEYAVSIHATGSTVERNRFGGSHYQDCEQCHTHEGYVANLDGMEAAGDDFTHIKCFTCHAPHSNGNLTLRVTTPYTLLNGETFALGAGELCASCHHSRADVNTFVTDPTDITSTHWGPHHSVQADMLIGSNGYEFSGFTYTSSPHSTAATNGCVTCHMAPKGIWANVGGHTWNMADPADDAQNVSACAQSGCHGASDFTDFNPDFPANSDYDWDGTAEGVQHEVEGLIDSLRVLMVDAGLVDGVDYEPISGTSFSADSAGCLFNYLFVEEDRSEGIHNTQYAVDLLQTSIRYLLYGSPNPPPTVAVRSGDATER